MYKFTIILILTSLLTLSSYADELRLQDNAPARYTVVKGDTLWDISGKFLQDPWKWPQIWGMNKEEIKNPHWIYPGDVIVLDTSGASPRLSLIHSGTLRTVVLSPEVRSSAIDESGIPPIPTTSISAFLDHPYVMTKDALDKAPRILKFVDDHLAAGAGDEAYATNDGSNTLNWKVLRPSNPLIDPATQAILGYKVIYLGEAHTVSEGNPQRILIVTSPQEIQKGDRLKTEHDTYSFRYVPHAPSNPVNGQVISTDGGLFEAGQYDTIILNKGRHDGLDEGTVLAVYKNQGKVEGITIPDSRLGLIMVYRAFDKVSYALIMQTTSSVNLYDFVRNP